MKLHTHIIDVCIAVIRSSKVVIQYDCFTTNERILKLYNPKYLKVLPSLSAL